MVNKQATPMSRGKKGKPAESVDHIEWELQNLSLVLQPPPSPAPTEPLGEVIHQYTDTLCTTQKQTNLTNSLLQDITVGNEYDFTKLEDWPTYIETAPDITNESQDKLEKAKLRGLTHTLVTEATSSGKSWEGIKDLLWLNMCNANIHTYTLYFMGIQQKEKESFAAYVKRFKTQPRRCNFTNDAANIRIFIKGLKMPLVWQHTFMKRDLKQSQMQSQRWRS